MFASAMGVALSPLQAADIAACDRPCERYKRLFAIQRQAQAAQAAVGHDEFMDADAAQAQERRERGSSGGGSGTSGGSTHDCGQV